MSKKRVYELARELGIDNKELISRLEKLGITVKSHSGTLEDNEVDRVIKEFHARGSTEVVEQRIKTTVIRRRAVHVPQEEPVAEESPAEAAKTVREEVPVKPAPPEEVKPVEVVEPQPGVPGREPLPAAKTPLPTPAISPKKPPVPPTPGISGEEKPVISARMKEEAPREPVAPEPGKAPPVAKSVPEEEKAQARAQGAESAGREAGRIPLGRGREGRRHTVPLSEEKLLQGRRRSGARPGDLRPGPLPDRLCHRKRKLQRPRRTS